VDNTDILMDGECLEVANTNRREDKRTPARVAVEITLLDVINRPQMRVQTVETSTTGMSFATRRDFKQGERVAIRLTFLNGRGKLVLAEVRHSKKHSATVHHVGVEFVDAVSLQDSNVRIPPRWIKLKSELSS